MLHFIRLILALVMFQQPYPPVTPPTTDPYPWYPSLDMNQIPWHVSAGNWGPQYPLQAPAEPVTFRAVTVHTSAAFNAEALVPGTEITIGTGWPSSTNVNVRASDIDIVVLPGVSVGPILIDAFNTNARSRVRVRGTAIGSHSGGKVGQIRDNANCTDIIVDGIDMDGSGFTGSPESNVCLRLYGTRYAIVNVRSLSSGNIWLGNAKHVTIAGCTSFHGAATRAQNGFVEGWGYRNSSGPWVMFDMQVRGGRYHNLRLASNNADGEYAWIANSDFISLAEARVAWLWRHQTALGNTGQAAIMDNCRVYTYADIGCILAFNLEARCDYSRVQNTTFYGAGGHGVATQAYLNNQASLALGNPGDHNWSINNTFLPLASPPLWRGPGDPTLIGLPNGMTFVEGEGGCPGF